MATQSDYSRKWYLANKDTQYKRVKANQKRIKNWVKEYKKTLKCSRCPETHPATFDFHHRDPSQKTTNIAHIYQKGWGLERIQEELDKCDVLCANCHRKEHYVEDDD